MERPEMEQIVHEDASTVEYNPNARGGEVDEYAKVLKIGIKENIKSLKGTLILPSERHTNFKDGFVNFYLGLDKMEAGISTVRWKSKWHWFSNNKVEGATNGDNGAFTQYDYGKELLLEMVISGSNLIYYVTPKGGTRVEARRCTYRNENNNGRFIFGAGINIGPSGLNLLGKLDANPSDSANILGTFPAYHNQATFKDMSYVRIDGVTKQVNSSNNAVTIEQIKWPIRNGKVLACKDPQYHTVGRSAFGQGVIYGSIK